MPSTPRLAEIEIDDQRKMVRTIALVSHACVSYSPGKTRRDINVVKHGLRSIGFHTGLRPRTRYISSGPGVSNPHPVRAFEHGIVLRISGLKVEVSCQQGGHSYVWYRSVFGPRILCRSGQFPERRLGGQVVQQCAQYGNLAKALDTGLVAEVDGNYAKRCTWHLDNGLQCATWQIGLPVRDATIHRSR